MCYNVHLYEIIDAMYNIIYCVLATEEHLIFASQQSKASNQ